MPVKNTHLLQAVYNVYTGGGGVIFSTYHVLAFYYVKYWLLGLLVELLLLFSLRCFNMYTYVVYI